MSARSGGVVWWVGYRYPMWWVSTGGVMLKVISEKEIMKKFEHIMCQYELDTEIEPVFRKISNLVLLYLSDVNMQRARQMYIIIFHRAHEWTNKAGV